MKTICLVLIIIVSFFPQPFMTQNALSLETNQNNGSYIAYHSSTAIATSTYNNRRNGLKFDILYTNYSRLEPPWVSDFNFSYYVFWANRNITDGWVEGTTAYNKTINITYPDIYIVLNNVTRSLYTQLGRSEGTVLRRFSMSCELAYINISYLNEAESRFNEIYNLYLNTTTGFPKNGPTDTRTNLLDWWTGLYFLYNLTNNNTYYYWLKKSIDTYISLCNETMFLSGDKIESDGTIINNPSTYDGYHNIGWSAHYFFTLVRIMQRLPGIVNETQKYYLADSIRRTLDLIYCNYSWGYFYYEFYAPLTGEVDNYYSTPRDVFAASVAIFDWARKILNNATFDEMVDNCTMSLDAYWREGYHFKWREDDTDLGSYDSFVAWAYNLLGANATRSRMHMLLSLLVGVAGPEIFYKTYDLPDISASHVSWSGYWSWSSGITKFVLSRAIGSYRYAKNLIPYPYPYISHYLNSILSKCFVSDGLRIKYSSTWEYGVARGIGIEDEVFSLYNLRLYNDTMHAASGIISSFRFSNLSTDNIILVYDLYLPDGLSMIYLPGVHNVSIEFYGNNSPIRYVSFVDDVIAFYSLSEQRVSLCIYVNAGKSYSYREDIDGDLLPDAFEVLYGVTNMNDDLDNDGLPNDWEAIFYSDPFDNDTDNDNISDLEEFYYTTNLLLPDSDYDGIYDSQEISWGYNPLNRHTISWKYTDYLYGIVLANKSGGFNWTEYYASLDTDNDAITNMEEYDLEYNPYDPVNKYFNIISPVWGQKFEGKSDIHVEWGYSGMYIEYFNIYLNGTFMQSTTSNDTILTNIGDGIWNVTVAGFAHASMVASDCVIIYVCPKLCVLYPENDSYLRGVVDIQFNVSSESISKAIVYLNTTSSDDLLYESDKDNTHSFELNTSEYSDGQYTFTFFANNTYSLGSYVYVDVTFDNTPPNITIVSPSEDEYLPDSSVTIKWQCMDISPVQYLIRIDDGSWIDIGNATQHRFEDLDDGVHLVEVLATDAVGLINSDIVRFTVDTIPPRLSILQPSDKEYIASRTVLVKWTCDDADIDHFEVKIDNGNWINVGLANNYTFASLLDGVHSVYVKAVDKSGRATTELITFTIDTVSPIITIGNPENNTYMGVSTVNVSWQSSDNYEIEVVRIFMDDTMLANLTQISGYYILENIPEGKHILRIDAIDKAGNEASDQIVIYIDLTPPVINIISPNNNSEIYGEVTISWNIRDNIFLDSVQIQIDNESWKDIDPISNITLNMSIGNHVIKIRATDKAGHTSEATIFFLVKEEQRPPPLLDMFLLSIILVTALVIIAVAVIYRRKKRSRSLAEEIIEDVL